MQEIYKLNRKVGSLKRTKKKSPKTSVNFRIPRNLLKCNPKVQAWTFAIYFKSSFGDHDLLKRYVFLLCNKEKIQLALVCQPECVLETINNFRITTWLDCRIGSFAHGYRVNFNHKSRLNWRRLPKSLHEVNHRPWIEWRIRGQWNFYHFRLETSIESYISTQVGFLHWNRDKCLKR